MTVRVATLNVWALPEPFAADVSARMRAIGDRLPALGVDAVAFQEVWTDAARRLLLAAGRRAGLEHAWHDGAQVRGSGLLLLSRWPLRDVTFERFSLIGDPGHLETGEYLSGKGFVHALVETPDGPFHWLATHLHARYGKVVPHEYRGLRTGQIVQLAARANSLEGPLVAVGDFNLRETHTEYRVLTGLTRLRDVAVELDQRQPTVFRGNAYRSRTRKDRRIDFVFVRDGGSATLAPRRVERVFDEPLGLAGRSAAYSNHAGVLAELELAPGPFSSPLHPTDDAVETAAALLAQGRVEALRRQRGKRAAAGVAAGGALLAAAGLRGATTSRRGFLRASLLAAVGLGLAPAIGFSVMSEVVAPGQLDAFDEAERRLAQLTDPEGAHLSAVSAGPPGSS